MSLALGRLPAKLMSSAVVIAPLAAIGASFTGVMVKVKRSLALSAPSEAVTLIEIVPVKLAGGVPLKVRVAGSNASQPVRW